MGAGSRPAVAAARPAPAPARTAPEPATPPPSRYTPPSIPVVPRFLAAPTPAGAPGYGTTPVEGPRELQEFSAPAEMSEVLFSDPANPTPSLLLSMETATLDAPASAPMSGRLSERLDGERLDAPSMRLEATRAPGGARTAPRAGGRAGAAAQAEPEVDPEAEISDSEAFGALSAEWSAEALEPLPHLELEAAPLPPADLDLKFPQKPPPPNEEESGAKRRKEAEDEALHAATDAYRGLAVAAHEHHDAVLSQARNRARELAERSEAALSQVDRNLAPRVDALLSSIEAGRRQIADGADAAEATVDQQAAQARRAIGGAVIGARKRIDAASTAATGQVPGIRTNLRRRFESTYNSFADEVKNSGAWAHRTLTGEAKKSAVRESIPLTGDPAAQAMADAKRRVVPPRLDELGNGLKAEADAQERNIRARMDAAPPGGASISASIEAFTQSISDSISGAGENKSLKDRGYAAVDKAQTASLNSLQQQAKAAREAVRHARISGEAQVALHRRSALQRLGSMRRTAREAMRGQAESALKALQATLKASLPLYGDAVKRIDSTLRGALPGGASGLSDAAKKAVPPVQRSLADGHRLQAARINQVATGAERGVQGQGDRLLTESDKAAQEFELLMAGVAQGLSAQLMQMAQQQSAGFKGLSRGVSSAADSFCQPIPTQYADAIARQVATLNPVHAAEDAAVSAEARRTVDAQRGKVENPLPEIQAGLTAVANALDQTLTSRKGSAWSALDHPVDIDENGLMAAFRGLSGLQAAAVEFKYNNEHANLRARVQAEHDATLGGLNDAEYNSVMSALNGDPSAAAFYELQTTTHWYGNDGERAAAVVEGLSDDQRRTLTSYGNWGEIADSVRAGLPATELNVFNALADGNRARADAIRSREAIDRARAQHDDAALITATTTLGAVRNDRDSLNPEATVPEAERRAAVQREFATLPGVRPAGAAPIADPSTLTPEQRRAQQTAAADALAAYATRTYSETRSDGEGGQYTVEFRVERTASTLVGAIARGGPDSVDARAARILYESERPGGDRPDTGALEGAVVDPRLNPTLTPNLTPAQRAAARQEQDQIFARYAELAAAHGVPGAPHNAEEARALASERLRLRYGDSESDRLGADYVHSVVTDPVPNPVIAMRFAMVGAGTNEDLIHRTLQRHSRAQIAQMRTDYRNEYGSDLFEDLGVYGRGSFGEVSGDDRLQTERELMGVPMNDRERAEVALFANQQQLNERGMLDVNEGSDEERALMRAQADLRRMAGGNVALDEFGRPSVEGGAFNAQTGTFTGDADAFNRGLNTSQGSVDAYVARTDRIASYVTTGIAVLGAAIAAVVTVATGGLAAPLLMAGIAAATGLASIAANQMIRGGRYGWEQAAVDLGMTAIQAATAGIGAQLGAGAALAAKGAQAAGATAAQLTRMGLLSAARIGAITGGIGGLGNAALNERTWDKGIGSGLGLVLEGGLKGSLSGAVTGVVSSGLESLGRGGATIGDRMNGLTATGPMALANMAGRGLMRSGISSVSAMAGRGSELLFDSATGRFHGSRHAVLASLAEAGENAAIQGFFEGAGESIGGRIHAQTIARRSAEIATERDRLGLPALDEQDLNTAASDLLLKERFADDPSSPEHLRDVARDGGWDPREFIANRARGRGAAADAAPSTRALPPAEDSAATALDAVKTAEEHNGEPPVPPPPTDTPADSPEPPRRPPPTEAEAAEVESRRSQRTAESEDSFGDAEFDALMRDLKHSPFGYELEAGKRATPAALPEDTSRTRAGVDHKAHADARANPPPGQEPGAQIQHWTKTLDVTRDLPAGMNPLHPDAINENISWLQSRKNLPSTTLHVDPEGGGTRIFIDDVPRGRTGDAGAPGEQLNLFEPVARPRQPDYNTEHKFADAALIPAIAEQIADSRRRAGLPPLDPRELAIAAGEQARWVMSGESGSERSGKVIDVAAIASSHPAPDRAGSAPAHNPNQLELDFNGPARPAASSEAEAPRVRIAAPDEPARVRIATDDEPTRVRIAVDDGQPRVRVQLDEDADLAHQLDDLAAAQAEAEKPAVRRLLADESDAEGLRVRHPDADAEGIMPDGTLDPDEVLPIVDDATDAHAFPDAMAHIDLSGAEALASYRQALADDMTREAGIYYDPVSDSYAVVQGRAFDVDPAVLFGDGGEAGRWQTVEHYHPGLDVAARYPSPEDFKAMMHWQTDAAHNPDSPHTVSSRILWIDAETGAEFHTIIGFKPGEDQPYYVQFRDHDGVEAHVTFRDPPWEANSDFKAFYKQEIEWATGSALAHVEDVANAPIPVLQAEIEAANAAAARAAAEADPEENIDTGVHRRADLGLPDAERPPLPPAGRAAPAPESEPARIVPLPESAEDAAAPHSAAPRDPAEAPRLRVRLDPPPEPVPPVHPVESDAEVRTRVQQDAEDEAELIRLQQHEERERAPQQRQVGNPETESGGRDSTSDRTAGGIAGSRFSGDAAREFDLPGTKPGQPYNVAETMAEAGGVMAGKLRITETPDGYVRMALVGRTPDEADIPVRLMVVDELKVRDGERPAAVYETDPDNAGGYVVKVSKNTPVSELPRALAHEFTEIRSAHGLTGPVPDAFGPGGKGTKPSPHDEGRMAELEVMGRQFAQLDPQHAGTAAAQHRLIDETQRLIDKLGLREPSAAAAKRLELARRLLGDSGPARTLFDQALSGIGSNPFLQKPNGRFDDDLALLTRRLAHVRKFGEGSDTAARRQAILVEQAALVVMRDRLVNTTQARDGSLTAAVESHRLGKLKASLPPDQLELLNLAETRARTMQPYRTEDSTLPTPGYEKRYLTEPRAQTSVEVPPDTTFTVNFKDKPRSMRFDEALTERSQLLTRQRDKRAEMNLPATTDARRAVLKREIEALIHPINKLSEALGAAAGRRFQQTDPLLSTGKILELPREGSGIPDLIVQVPAPPAKGRLVIIECKGGDADLITRDSADRRVRVQQGHREYLVSLAETMLQSKDATIKAYGQRLRDQLEDAGVHTQYFLVRQPVDFEGNPGTPEVGEFDIR